MSTCFYRHEESPVAVVTVPVVVVKRNYQSITAAVDRASEKTVT